MATFIIAGLILGAAAYIIYKKVMKMKRGDFTCEGCKGGSACSNCPAQQKLNHQQEDEQKD